MIRVVYYLSFLIFSCATSATSLTLTGVGFSNCKKITQEQCLLDAQQQAVAMISGQIFVNVETNASVFKQKRNNTIESIFETSTRTHSNMPIYGATQVCEQDKTNSSIKCTAQLNKLTSVKLYIQSAERLAAEIDKTYLLSSQQKFVDNYTAMSMLVSKLATLKQYEAIINSLDPNKHYQVRVLLDLPTLELLLTDMVKKPVSMATFITRIKHILPVGPVLIKPAILDDQSISEFAVEVFRQLNNSITHTVSDEQSADYILSGSMNYEADSVAVMFNLINKETLQTQASVLSYINHTHRPKQADTESFQQSLFSQYGSENRELFVDIKTNKGKRGLLFSESETLTLSVLVSKPSCFYISGFINNKSKEIGYLLPLHDRPQSRTGLFIDCVDATHINTWRNIGSFTVEPPFGVESLQVSAALKLLVNDLPSSQLDEASGYQVIANNKNDALAKTRGLKRISATRPATQLVHAVLQFNTVGM